MSSGTETHCFNPATGEAIGISPLHGVEDVKAAIDRARSAQPAWASLSVGERSRFMLRVRDHIVAHADELAETISQDNGKTRLDALATEVMASALAADYYARKAASFLEDRRLKRGTIMLANKSSKIVRVPFGVVGIISPWNYPFSIPFSEVVMGLMAGNAVVLKTASQTQMVGLALKACFEAAQLPPGLFTFLNLPGSLAGDAFLDGGVDKLFFTGSVPVGKELMAKAAQTLTPVSLELGGNDAMLVCADADLDRAAAGAVWAGMQNCGQSCGGVERIYVHQAVYEGFMEKLGERVRALRVGPDLAFDVDMGAMTTKGQMETVRRHVQDALEKGAEIYAQSPCPENTRGQFLPAMVLANVDHTMVAMREETFGPIVGVMKVKDMEEAVALANDSDLGLSASVWSRDKGGAERIGRRIRAGAVLINDHLMSHGMAETPWGGFKQSGIGRTHGEIGFAEMTEPQVIVHDWMPKVRRDLWWYPQGPDVYRGIRGILDMLYGPGIARRVSGFCRMVKILPRMFRP
jgi:acyl-CoA reductase-like NAD-dependent aldehyde dehydrogenase